LRAGDRVRSTNDGQLGFLVDDGGALKVCLDRPGARQLRPYHERQWVADREPALTEMAIARICHDADRAYRIGRGEYSLPDWIALTEQARIGWMKGPPAGASSQRRALYTHLRQKVRDL